MSTEGSKRAIVAAMIANLGIAIAKFAGFVFTMSSSLLAESIHSLADTGNQVLLLLGGKRSAMPPTRLHQFGFGRERYFWSFVVSIILFSLGSMFALYEGVEKVLHPHPLESPSWAIGILAFSIVLEANSFRTAIREAKKVKGKSSWNAFIRRSKSPELPVVILEDSGALLGLTFAMAAVVTAAITGDGVWDGVGSITIGLLLGVIAIVLAIEMKSLLIGESASPEDEAQIAELISSSESVTRVIALRTQHIGPDDILVAAKVEFDGSLTIASLATVIDRIEGRVRAAVPAATRIFIEPDVVRPELSDASDPWSGLDDRSH
jgi:cation diffusion facilitator family transporter